MDHRSPILSASLAAVVLTGCATASPPPAAFDPSAVAWSTQVGANTLAGVARLETIDGKVRTCAKLPVRLAPDSPYARERIQRLYGDGDMGYVSAREADRARMQAGPKVDEAYEMSLKTAVCDARGRFVFKYLADGTYYLLAPVVWKRKHAKENEGGFFMQRVTIGGGEGLRVTLSRSMQSPLASAGDPR